MKFHSSILILFRKQIFFNFFNVTVLTRPLSQRSQRWIPMLFIRMFLVYNEETGRFQTGRQYPTLILVSLSSVDETKVKLEAVGMPSVIFEVPNSSENASEAVQCTMWWGEPVKCIDCGTEPAEWLSRSPFVSFYSTNWHDHSSPPPSSFFNEPIHIWNYWII